MYIFFINCIYCIVLIVYIVLARTCFNEHFSLLNVAWLNKVLYCIVCRGIEQVREAKSSRKKKDKAVSFFKKWLRKKYSSSRQSSETKPNAKLVLVNCEPWHHLQFNKPNKQNVPEINSFNKFNFPLSQNNYC